MSERTVVAVEVETGDLIITPSGQRFVAVDEALWLELSVLAALHNYGDFEMVKSSDFTEEGSEDE